MKQNKISSVANLSKVAELCTFLIKNKIATKDDTIESIFAKIMESDENNKKNKIKKEKIDISKIIRKECQENENIFILSMDKNFSFLLKKKEEAITRVLGEGTMNPVEQQRDVIFFDCFALFWKLTKKEESIPQLEKLKEYGFPVYHVETEYDIISSIEKP
jgi:hypothetical protein